MQNSSKDSHGANQMLYKVRDWTSWKSNDVYIDVFQNEIWSVMTDI